MPPRCLGRVKHGHGTVARRDDPVIGKADPLAAVLIEELVANRPIGRPLAGRIRLVEVKAEV